MGFNTTLSEKNNSLPIVNPPRAFGRVETNVYRSNRFSSNASFDFIDKLNLKTVVDLSLEEIPAAASAFFNARSIHLVQLGRQRTSHAQPLSEEMVKDAIECVLDVRKHPLLVMCTTGIHITGAVIGCLRRLQQWSLTSIIDKYRNQAGNVKTKFEYEQFIELFDVDLITLPSTLPDWFTYHFTLLENEKSLKEDETGYKKYFFDTQGALTSPDVTFSIEKSIVDDDID